MCRGRDSCGGPFGGLQHRGSALHPVEEEKGERREGKGVEKGHTVNKHYCLRHRCK